MRVYAALTLTWSDQPDQDWIDGLLAELDEFGPTAIEELPSGLQVFFGSTAARDTALTHFTNRASVSCSASEVPDENWAERSQAALTPVTIERLTIAPPWTVTPAMRAQAPGPVIVIQPSMGFGTGHHASTRLCLHWLQQVPLSGASVIDVGTGSGVLAIAAKVLGAADVLGVDIDPDALQSAQENLELNGLSGMVALREVDLSVGASRIGRTFDLITANLTGGLLCRDAGELTALASPGAHLIASGFQAHETVDVAEAFSRAGWDLAGEIEEQDWVGVQLTRRT